MTGPAPTPPGDRVLALDVVRGLAVLGILVMNVVEFGLPLPAYENPAVAGGAQGADLWTWLLQTALFEGRMRALFSLLFGAGIVLLGDRLATKGQGGADVLLRRCLWLIPFGIAHRFLLQYTGDILYAYGLLGVLAVAFRGLRPRVQIILGLLALLAFTPIEYRRYDFATGIRQQVVEAEQLTAAGETVPPELAAAERWWQQLTNVPSEEEVAGEVAAMRGSWVGIVRFRWDQNHLCQHAFLYDYVFWDVFGMMLVGMALLRLGFFAGRLRRAFYVGTVAVGAAAAAASLLLALERADASWSAGALELRFWHQSLHPFLRGLTALGWAGALILGLRTASGRRAAAPLAAVGRMAFSNYILQTLLCTSLFFGWGLSLYGTLSRAQLMLVVAGASAVQIAFSMLWLRRFRFGPIEWAWRSLTYWHRPPFRR